MRVGSPPNRAKRAGFWRLRRYRRASSGPGRRKSPTIFPSATARRFATDADNPFRRSSPPIRAGRAGGRGVRPDGGPLRRWRTRPDHPGLSRTIPDGEGGRERLRRGAGNGQAIGKTRVPETGAGPGEVEQGGRGRLPARCREPPQAVEANGRGDRRSMTRSLPLAPTIRPRARRVKRTMVRKVAVSATPHFHRPPPPDLPLDRARSRGAERGVGVPTPSPRRISK